MKKKTIKILSIIFGIMIVLSLIGFISFLSFNRAGGEIGFDAVINRVEPEYNMAYATVTDQDAGLFSKKLPESIMFNTSDLDVELKAGVKIQGCYLSGTISGDSVRVVSIAVLEQNATAPNKCLDEVAGNMTFYEEPAKEAQTSGGTVTVRLYRDLNEEQADKLKDILDDVDEWIDDHSVDRLAYYFDGDFELSDREHKYYFTYEYNVIYYDHYFAEIPAEDMQVIKDIAIASGQPVDLHLEQPGSFSYAEVTATFKAGDPGVKSKGFVNTESAPISRIWDVKTQALNECTIKYDTVTVNYDEAAEVWEVMYSTANTVGNCQSVYMDRDGVTLLIAYGE